MNSAMLLARRRILFARQSGATPCTDMVLLINSTNTGDFSVTTNYGEFMAVKVSDYPHFDTTVTHKLSIGGVTFSSEGKRLSDNYAVSKLFVGVESWGTSNTYTKTSDLFRACTNLRGIPSSWKGLEALTESNSMFRDCTSLTSIPASWKGLEALTESNSMFYRCASLTSIPASWEGLANATRANAMFRGCTSLTSIPDSWEGLEALTEAVEIFRGCTSLTNCGTTFTGLAKATNVRDLFNECTGMLGNIHALYVYLSTKPIAVSNFSRCFRNCTQAVGYESIPASWK